MASNPEVIKVRNELRLTLLRKAQSSDDTESLIKRLEKCKISVGLLIHYSPMLALSVHGAQIVKSMISFARRDQLPQIGLSFIASWPLFETVLQCDHGIEVVLELLKPADFSDDLSRRSSLAREILEKSLAGYWYDHPNSLPVLEQCFPLVDDPLQSHIIRFGNFLSEVFKLPANSEVIPPMISHLSYNKPHIMEAINPWLLKQIKQNKEFVAEMATLILTASLEFAEFVLCWMMWFDKLFGLRGFLKCAVEQSSVSRVRRVMITRVVVGILLTRNSCLCEVLDDPDTVDFIVQVIDLKTRKMLAEAVLQRRWNKLSPEFAEQLCARLTSGYAVSPPCSPIRQEKDAVIDLGQDEEAEEQQAAADDVADDDDINEIGHSSSQVDRALEDALLASELQTEMMGGMDTDSTESPSCEVSRCSSPPSVVASSEAAGKEDDEATTEPVEPPVAKRQKMEKGSESLAQSPTAATPEKERSTTEMTSSAAEVKKEAVEEATTSSSSPLQQAQPVEEMKREEDEVEILEAPPKVIEDDDDIQIIEVPKTLSSIRNRGARPLLSARRQAKPAEVPLDEEQTARQSEFMLKLEQAIATEKTTVFKYFAAALLSGRVPRPVELADRICESAAALCTRSEGGLNLVVLVAEKWPHTRLNMSLAVGPLIHKLCLSGSGRRLLRHLLVQKTKQCFANLFFKNGGTPFMALLNEEHDLADDVFDLAERSLKEACVKAHKDDLVKTKHGVEFFRVLTESGLIPDLVVDVGAESKEASPYTVSAPDLAPSTVASEADTVPLDDALASPGRPNRIQHPSPEPTPLLDLVFDSHPTGLRDRAALRKRLG
ncbi:hypothetical protein PMAYCL1PPCAC_04299 [Pristionchus mayeri]|uniref:Uncharacterized protein n=1 Tax=Pristionchus mayeri TaxID=1317129 RepID=A0AAN4Z6A0_9BILA|nr:hypothetical protein PMAYCL1PPCAC_04299 [Pristionchus mayeri]